jgi:hypothetical protein
MWHGDVMCDPIKRRSLKRVAITKVYDEEDD